MKSGEKGSPMELLIRILAVIGAISLLSTLLAIGIGVFLNSAGRKVHSRTILEIDLTKGLRESHPETVVNMLASQEYVLIRDIVLGLDAAAKDNRIKGVIAYMNGGLFKYADVQEIRDAIIRFKKSGKPAMVFAETFGSTRPGNSSYYLATAFDYVALQPSGELGLTGLVSESQFVMETLDKLDIKPQLEARAEYKTARNMFTEKSYTPEHKEMARSIISSVEEKFVSDIALARKIEVPTLKSLIRRGPFTAAQALHERLVDTLEYKDQLYKRIKQGVGKNPHLLYISKYVQRNRSRPPSGKAIALIYGEGSITQGKSRQDPFSGDMIMGAQTIAKAFRAASRDKTVGAIVFRVNSPGGSYVGSDMIWRAALVAQSMGKPLIVTMGATAGSGGYFVTMNADKILAQPSTITGSIGVVGGKLDVSGLFNKFGVTFDRVSTSPNATIWLPTTEYTPDQWNYIQHSLDTIYNDFVRKFASGRKLALEKAYELAKGRIYTGSQALSLGLVDTLGGLYEAFREAKKLMNIPEDKPVLIKKFPKRVSLWERLWSKGMENSEDVLTDDQLLNKEPLGIHDCLKNTMVRNSELIMERLIVY